MVGLLAAAAVVLAGCAAEPASTAPVITMDAVDEMPAGEVVGPLVLEDGCLTVGDSVALFPAGAEWDDATEAVTFADGTAWSVGDEVHGGGGYLPAVGIRETRLGDNGTRAAYDCAQRLGAAEVAVISGPIRGPSTSATLYYQLEEPVAEDAFYEAPQLLTARTVAIEDTGDPGVDALHALLTLPDPEPWLTVGFNFLGEPDREVTVDVESVRHEDGVVHVELTGNTNDPYPNYDICCVPDGTVVAQQLVHTVQAALDTTDPVSFGGRDFWFDGLPDPIEADHDLVVPPTDVASEVEQIDLPTSEWTPGEGGDGALVAGEVSQDGDGCVVLANGSRATYAVWPKDWTAWEAGDRLVLLDAEGRLVASEGDRVQAGGGYGRGPTNEPCIPSGRPGSASIQSELTLVASPR